MQKKTINLRKKFVKNLFLKILKNKGTVNVNEIMYFCKDILVHLKNDNEDEYETNQQCLGMIELFRRYAVNA